jgi:hypothetical protein
VRVKVVEPSLFKTGFHHTVLEEEHAPDYDAGVHETTWGVVYLENEKAPTPEAVAKAILKGRPGPSPKLRYPVKAWVLLTLTRTSRRRVPLAAGQA